MFSDFNPKLPKGYKNAKYVFLANIDPHLQEKVLDDVKKPALVMCDTMNYWIENKRKKLLGLLKKVHIFLVNESEARLLTGETSIVKAARAIMKFGSKRVIIKKGEHGVLLFSRDSIFSVPAFLLESIFDPTGAGDTFAGALVGFMARSGKINEGVLRRAIVHGSIMATFAVQDFSLRRLASITRDDIAERFREFRKLTAF